MGEKATSENYREAIRLEEAKLSSMREARESMQDLLAEFRANESVFQHYPVMHLLIALLVLTEFADYSRCNFTYKLSPGMFLPSLMSFQDASVARANPIRDCGLYHRVSYHRQHQHAPRPRAAPSGQVQGPPVGRHQGSARRQSVCVHGHNPGSALPRAGRLKLLLHFVRCARISTF